MKKILWILTINFICSLAFAEAPKVRVLVEPTDDRWIHFPDGAKVRHGMEVTHMLNQFLYETDMFRVQVPMSKGVGLDPIGINSKSLVEIDRVGQDEKDELSERLPNHNIDYIDRKAPNHQYGINAAHIIVKPVVHTLLYSSGKRSNRVVYGFSPDRINPYNAGIDGESEDNEFTAQSFDEVNQCSTLDFFDGQLKTRGWAHKRSNFGADADEGFSFEIFGFGVSFKKKAYAIKLGIEFEVFFPNQNLRQTYNYEFKAKGVDLNIGASYAGVHLGFEQQRRFTMRNALAEGLPKMLDEFMADLPEFVWQSSIKQSESGEWMLRAGVFDGMHPGFILEAENGNRYAVTDAFEEHSLVIYAMDNEFPPVDGEVLRAVPLSGESPWQRAPGVGNMALAKGVFSKMNMESSLKNNFNKKLETELMATTSPELVERRIGNCVEKKHSWFEKIVMSLMTFYGQWRYDNVYDQEFPQTVGSKAIGTPKVAIIGSGVFPGEKSVKNHLEASGFDFISWDKRPSDDLGTGTAAAKYLVKKSKKDFSIVPVKVFGAHGETHSSAIYGAMDWVSSRDDIDMVLVPWIPKVKSRAYKEGLRKMVASGKKVIAPKGSDVYGIISAKSAKKKYKTRGIRKAKLQLSKEGVGVMGLGAEYINKWTEK